MFFLLDLIVYPSFHSFFFLNVLNSKNLYYIIFISLILDFIIGFNTYGFITIMFILLYFLDQKIKGYYAKNIFNNVVFALFLAIFFDLNVLELFFPSIFFSIIFIYLMKRSYT